ncbi:MAG: hypothetical protein CVU11_09545 [Bacteroidetes bacterium HGW-Bacteroidetes-6]|jgi:glycosyltransferase involved in cell wall biosynthesis|nr:MAG: hypothetical protein CVU11_09545 [Bacteroidetes bacterium HGW-Bacteroidetes-6]
MNKPRILRILNRFNLGGPTYNASLLTKYLSDNYETLLIGGPNEKNEHDSMHIPHSLGIEPLIVDSMVRSVNLYQDRKAYNDIKKIIADFKPDIVHTHASKAGALGRRAAHHLNVPAIVHTYHGHVFEAYFNGLVSNFYKGVERRLSRKTDAIIALSERQRNDLVLKHRICKPELVHIIPNGFDLDKFQIGIDEKRRAFRSKYHLAPDDFAIGIIGRMVPVKNHRLFVEVIDRVMKKNGSPPRVFIVGDGETKDATVELLQQKEIAFTENGGPVATVHFTSWQTDVDAIIAGLDLVALTSLNEGTPVCLIEAQAANCPVVSTDVGGIRDIVVDGRTALLSPGGNADVMANNIVRLMTDKAYYSQFKTDGNDFVRNRFHFMRMVKDVDELYQTLLKR